MNQALKILTVFGTRPEVIKLFPILDRVKKDGRFRSIVVCTSQHREMIEDLLALFDIEIDHDLNIMRPDQSLTDISTRVLCNLEPLLKAHSPDLLLVQGDTTTALAGALAAFYQKIPVGHVEAGLRSFDKMHPYPEEINRRLISPLASIHFTPTRHNAVNLFSEGIPSSHVFVTGNTVIDSLLYVAKRNGGTLGRYLPVNALNSHRLVLVTAHRRENHGVPLENLCHALRELVHSFTDIRILYPVHLNPNVKKTVYDILGSEERIHLVDPLPYEPFVEAMRKSYLILTDSGGIQEEGPSLRIPVLVFRKVTERPEGVSTGGVKIIGVSKEKIVQEVAHLLENSSAYRKMMAEYNPYGDGRAAERILQAILFYFNRGKRPDDFRSEDTLKEKKKNETTQ